MKLHFFNRNLKNLGQVFSKRKPFLPVVLIRKTFEKIYGWIFRKDWIFYSYFALSVMWEYLVEILHVPQSIVCLTADTCLTADPVVASSIQPGPILWRRLIMNWFLWPFSPFRWFKEVVVSYKQNYAHNVLVNRLIKICPGKRRG